MVSSNEKYNPAIHHRRSIRLQACDYSRPGAYFVTICVQDHICIFGEIKNGLTVLSPLGETARECWMEIPAHYPRVSLAEFVVMPNHIHGIIIIHDENNAERNSLFISKQTGMPMGDLMGVYSDSVGVQNFEPLRDKPPISEIFKMPDKPPMRERGLREGRQERHYLIGDLGALNSNP